tara:strand:+ start:229 stop:1104 length:876 start_codon:yes stop_codon:yes gene_type:complete
MKSFKAFMAEQKDVDVVWGDFDDIESILENIFKQVISEGLDLDESLTDQMISKLKKKTQPGGNQPWADTKVSGQSGGNDKDKILDLYTKYEPLIMDRLKKYESGLKSSTKGISQGVKILVDVKKLKAFVDKTVVRGKNPANITDWLRGSILVASEEDVGIVSQNIFKKFKTVREFEPKVRGSDETFGYYGSVHFLVDVDGVTAEIQVMTKKLYSAKKIAGGQYDDFRSAEDAVKDTPEVKALLRHGKRAFDKGNNRGGGAGINVDKQKSKYTPTSGFSLTDRKTRRALKNK